MSKYATSLQRVPLLIMVMSLFQFACFDARINVREGLPAPFTSDERFESANYERITKLYKTSSSKYRYKTQQNYEGIPIFGAYLVFEQEDIDSSVAKPVFGTWHSKDDIDIDINPQISSFEALKIAFASLNITHYNRDNISSIGDAVLYLYPVSDVFHLVYLVRVSHESVSAKVIVSANSAEIIKIYDAKKGFISVCGVGGNDKIGNVSYCGANSLSINDVDLGHTPILANHLVQIYHNLNRAYDDKSVSRLITCSLDATSGDYIVDDTLVNGGYCTSCDVFEFTNFIFDVFNQYLGTLPVSDEHIPLKAYVHVGTSWDSSNYDDIHGSINFGDGSDGVRYPLGVIDIVGHEIGHAFTAKTSGLINSGQSGAIDNFYADFVGEFAEYLYYGSNDWKIGAYSYASANGAQRYFDDPTLDGVSIDSTTNYVNGMLPYYASGIYAKAIYLLNTQFAWSMVEIFTIFSRSNELYWSPEMGFNDALCATFQCLTDLYTANSTKLVAMAHTLTQAFDTVGVQCDANQTKTYCGANKNTFCIYKVITPSLSEDTSFIIPVQLLKWSWNDGLNATVYLTVRDTTCKVPSISFEYETIDLGRDVEWIKVRDSEKNVIQQCGQNHQCGQWNTTCLVDRSLGISGISPDTTYPITINVAEKVSATLCDHDLGLNARLILHCAQHTPAPTQPQPTAAPSTSAPTSATSQPTAVTMNPTQTPTHRLTDCGDHRHCYDVNVYPQTDTTTQTLVPIQNIDENADVYYDVRFSIVGFDCIRPYIDFEYEEIDNNGADEYLAVYNTNGEELAKCWGKTSCGTFAPCLWQEPLANTLEAGSVYNISVMETSKVDAGCKSKPLATRHLWSINARLTITCQDGTAAPTQIPSSAPTKNPTPPTPAVPTAAPTSLTAYPTSAPTEYYECGSHTLCYNVEVAPIVDTATEWKYTLQYGDTTVDRRYNVLFNLKENSNDCVNPSISVRYEQIDYDGIDEYFEVFDNEGANITRCGDNSTCGVFDDCLVDYNLGLNGIAPNTTYQIQIFEPISIDPQCAPDHTFSINADITLKCGAGTMNPTLYPTVYPSLSPSQVTLDPTPSPTYYRESCGLNKYCYHLTVFPEIGVDKTWDVAIQNAGDGIETYFDIYIAAYHVDCVSPTITFEFERIDSYSTNTELTISESNGFNYECGGERKAPNLCGVLDTCFRNASLGLNRIKREDSIKLSVKQPQWVDALCPDSDLSINAKLSITCYGATANPTGSPTPEPTISPTVTTKSPSNSPSGAPTMPSTAPTMAPTFFKQSCGDHRYCMSAPIDPLESVDSTFTVPIQNLDEMAILYYEIDFTPNAFDCRYPSISFVYSGIDYNSYDEYINVSDAKGAVLAKCKGNSDSCDTFEPCYNDSLPIQQIKSGLSYTVYITQSAGVDSLCADHDWVLNAQLSITCHNAQSALSLVPTGIPTPEPTYNPSAPSAQPSRTPSGSPTVQTMSPTPSPTDVMVDCGVNKQCVYVDLYPNLDATTVHDVPLTHVDINAAFSYDVIFSVANSIECTDPRLTFNFELIDYESEDEYINITNVDGTVIGKCGAIPYGHDCGTFVDCFNGVAIGQNINKIGLSDTYTIGVYVTDKVDASCKYSGPRHSYAVNAVLSLTCAKGTTMPTGHPTTPYPTAPTLQPTVSPSVDPTTPTLQPTLSPTWSVLCGEDLWCYSVDISPSLTMATMWTVPVQFDDNDLSSGADGSTFHIRFKVTSDAANSCNAPRLSLTYETIDYEWNGVEHFTVTDNNGNEIAVCGEDNPPAACNVFAVCFSDLLLQNQIGFDEEYLIAIYQSKWIDSDCSALGNPYSLNASLVLQCESGTAKPSQAPSEVPSPAPTAPTSAPTTAIPTTPTQLPTTSPTYSMVSCAVDTEDRYCAYIDMFPDFDEVTSYPVVIRQEDPAEKMESIFDIYFTANDADCVEPMITFVYERMDHDLSNEYIGINVTASDSQSYVFAQCRSATACGEYETCFNQTRVPRLSNIKANEAYKISVIRSAESEDLAACAGTLALNAELTMRCNPGTAAPTPDPTPSPSKGPTAPSVNPTARPSLAPSTVTLEPTRSPTYDHQVCGDTFRTNKWCYFVPIEPLDDEWIEYVVDMEGLDDGKETTFEITFSSQYIDCEKPSITLKYENTDFDGEDEFIEVMDHNNQILAKCGTIAECGTFDYCLKNYELNTTAFVAGRNYTVSVIGQASLDGRCGHDLALKAELILKCNNGISEVTVPPDNSGTACGINKYCFERIMYPSHFQDTVWTQQVLHLNAEATTTEFEIVFLSHNERCYDPKLQFIYERIDFDQSNEFIDVYDNNSVLISRCGAGKVPNECGAFDICLSENELATSRGFIEMSDEYKVTLYESSQVDALCRHNHSYSMNAFVSLSCATASSSTSNALFIANTSIDIFGSNTFSDELFENIITAQKEQAHLKQQVTYRVNNYDCLRPIFSVTTNIKVNSENSQNLWIYNNDMERIGQCISSDSSICPHSMQCITDYALNDAVLSVDATYTFVIYLILDATDWCDTEDTIKTQLSFECEGMPSVSPTEMPSALPTVPPTDAESTVETESDDESGDNSPSNAGDKNSETTVIVVIVVVAVCLLLGAFAFWYCRRNKHGVKSKVETEMQETNRLTAKGDGNANIQTMNEPMNSEDASPSPDDSDNTGGYAAVDIA